MNFLLSMCTSCVKNLIHSIVIMYYVLSTIHTLNINIFQSFRARNDWRKTGRYIQTLNAEKQTTLQGLFIVDSNVADDTRT